VPRHRLRRVRPDAHGVDAACTPAAPRALTR
jgi:hypothetical protein